LLDFNFIILLVVLFLLIFVFAHGAASEASEPGGSRKTP